MTKAGRKITYQYNRDGLRTRKTVADNGTAAVTEYVWANERLLGVKTGEDTLRLLYQGDSCIGFVRNNTDVYLYVKNLQGDVTGIADKTGTVVVSYTYDAWGNILTQSGDAAIAKLNPITYRGYNYDAETGLYYLQSRYYSPEWGRFLNGDNVIDTNMDTGSCNLFTYCGNSPVNCLLRGRMKKQQISHVIRTSRWFLFICSFNFGGDMKWRKVINQTIIFRKKKSW